MPSLETRAIAVPMVEEALERRGEYGKDKLGQAILKVEADQVARRIADEVVFGRPSPAPKPAPAPAREEPQGRTRTFRRGLIRRIVRSDGP